MSVGRTETCKMSFVLSFIQVAFKAFLLSDFLCLPFSIRRLLLPNFGQASNTSLSWTCSWMASTFSVFCFFYYQYLQVAIYLSKHLQTLFVIFVYKHCGNMNVLLNNCRFRNTLCNPKVFLIISTVHSQFQHSKKFVSDFFVRSRPFLGWLCAKLLSGVDFQTQA